MAPCCKSPDHPKMDSRRRGFYMSGYHYNTDTYPRQWRPMVKHKKSGKEIDPMIFTNILITENELRQSVQREAALEEQVRALRKKERIEGATIESNQLDQELQAAQQTRRQQEQILYEHETMIPVMALKRFYDSLREDPAWYLRQELVKDCKSRGGCCSRSCGCCARRHHTSTRNRGIGHCTLECGCCTSFQGFELTESEKRDITARFKDRLKGDNKAFFLTMVDAFFSKPSSSACLLARRRRKIWLDLAD